MKTPRIRALFTAGSLAILSIACGSEPEPEPDRLAAYRANIGKTAFNSINGVERGRIEAVEVINGGADTVYQVNREGRVTNAPVSGVVVRDVPSSVAIDPKPLADGASIAPALQGAAGEFRGRLARSGGQLKRFTDADNRLIAAWSSEQCDSFRSEATDLLISLNREFDGAIESIKMERTCGSDTQTLSLSGAKYERYRSGQIGDAELFR